MYRSCSSAVAFVAALGIAGVVTQLGHLDALGWNLYAFTGLAVIYLDCLIPLMAIVVVPALDGLRPQWREGRPQRRRHHLAVLAPRRPDRCSPPSLLGGFVLLFGSAFAAHATAAALVGGSVPLVTLKTADAPSEERPRRPGERGAGAEPRHDRDRRTGDGRG
ncbi:hypothetical protein SMICM304S_10920 [Streptomyces microflavus]